VATPALPTRQRTVSPILETLRTVPATDDGVRTAVSHSCPRHSSPCSTLVCGTVLDGHARRSCSTPDCGTRLLAHARAHAHGHATRTLSVLKHTVRSWHGTCCCTYTVCTARWTPQARALRCRCMRVVHTWGWFTHETWTCRSMETSAHSVVAQSGVTRPVPTNRCAPSHAPLTPFQSAKG
jgi:hypothetical protein